MKRRVVIVITAVLCAGTGGLLVIERSSGAADYGPSHVASACTAPADPFPGAGLDATLQRIVLSGLNGAACDLGTTREALLLSLAPNSGFDDVHWDRPTAERALRRGFERAIADAVGRGSLPEWAASILRVIVRRAPVDLLLKGVALNPFG
ncbi:MAG: hypothetical protein M3011_03430 [Actinomycetota bacterium]|nr:hypothetical protein [Actinomycetota bacterium]